MIDPKPGLSLPLVNHLVQQRVLDLVPPMPRDMASAQGKLDRSTGANIHRELSQPAAHPAGEPDGDLLQHSTEMFLIELAMERLEPVKQEYVSRTGAVSAPGSHRRRRMLFHRELEKLALGHAA
jgi:hypothetical protein